VTRDDHMAAEHHQQMLEQQRADEEAALLRADPAYEAWLKQLNERPDNEIPRESIR